MGMAAQQGMLDGLTGKHWQVIQYIRNFYRKTGGCPLVYQTCRDFHELFPSGYLRGACLIAGITYKDRFINYYGEPGQIVDKSKVANPRSGKKVYRVDIHGFLIDDSDWDEGYAANKASEMKIPGGLTPEHWKIINYLRGSLQQKGTIPTVFECCEENEMELDSLEQLFPDGYHRGAVKIAGLRQL